MRSKRGKSIGLLVLIGVQALMLGCNDAGLDGASKNASETSDAVPGERLPIMVGIANDGTPFFDWDGAVQFSHQSNGKLDWKDGANLKGNFRRQSDGGSVAIDVQLKVEGEVYSIAGSYSSSVPFVLTYLGTGEGDADDLNASFEAGEGQIEYRGSAPYTFETRR